jgi:hypothetical protein
MADIRRLHDYPLWFHGMCAVSTADCVIFQLQEPTASPVTHADLLQPASPLPSWVKQCFGVAQAALHLNSDNYLTTCTPHPEKSEGKSTDRDREHVLIQGWAHFLAMFDSIVLGPFSARSELLQ